jgi:hypothetical protein
MNRRAFLFAALSASAAAGAARAATDIRVIYIGGGDCPPCATWKKTFKSQWMASPEFRQVTWIEVEPPRLREAYQERYWPGDLGPILDQIPRKSGTPRFLIVQDGRIVSNEFGRSRWMSTVAAVKNLLGS